MKSWQRKVALFSVFFAVVFGLGLSQSVMAAQVEDNQDSFWDFHGSIGPEEGKFDTYVPPVSSPLMNETPHITTELRPIFWFHKVPRDSVVGSSEVYLVALQARVALTERLGIIATKDGYAWIETDKALEDESGFANIALGLKYALLYNPEDEFILTVGTKYEIPSGKLDLSGIRFQGTGKGLLDLFVSAEKRFDSKLGVEASFGWTIPFDTNRQSGLVHYHAHLDYELFENFFPTFEYNGYTVANKGRERALDFEGVDVFNLGNNGGGTVNTLAAGFRYRFNDNVQFGTAWEWSVGRADLIEYRYQFDFVISL